MDASVADWYWNCCCPPNTRMFLVSSNWFLKKFFPLCRWRRRGGLFSRQKLIACLAWSLKRLLVWNLERNVLKNASVSFGGKPAVRPVGLWIQFSALFLLNLLSESNPGCPVRVWITEHQLLNNAASEQSLSCLCWDPVLTHYKVSNVMQSLQRGNHINETYFECGTAEKISSKF